MSRSTQQVGLPAEASETSIETGDKELTLEEVTADLAEAHRMLDQHKQGALTLAAELEEVRRTAEAEGNRELADTARFLRRSALAVSERIEGN